MPSRLLCLVCLVLFSASLGAGNSYWVTEPITAAVTGVGSWDEMITTLYNQPLSSSRGVELLTAALQQPSNKSRAILMNGLGRLETQMNLGACAPASAVTVLNALNFKSPLDPTYTSYGGSAYPFWTQQAFIYNECAKKYVGAHVFGETLANFSAILSCIGLKTKTVHASEVAAETAIAQIRDHLKQNHYVVTNFDRKLVHEEGGGHFSPIGASVEGMFLILDVARYKYQPTWVPEESLVAAMKTRDVTQSGKSRGFVAIWV